MAGKPLNRLELRRQNDAAEPLDPMEDESEELVDDTEEDDGQERRAKKKKAPAKKPKAVKAAKPATRMRIVWTVMNDAFKPVGTFEYAQKEAAEARAAELRAKGKGPHFVQKTKEPMPDNAPGLGASIPRPVLVPTEVVVKEAAAAVEDEEDLEDEEEETEAEAEAEMDDEPEEEE
jgi:hypothetical protein